MPGILIDEINLSQSYKKVSGIKIAFQFKLAGDVLIVF